MYWNLVTRNDWIAPQVMAYSNIVTSNFENGNVVDNGNLMKSIVFQGTGDGKWTMEKR